jgi:hypothetical protein
VVASSHVPLYSLVESTQRVYGVGLFFVSARTNKDIIITPLWTASQFVAEHGGVLVAFLSLRI